MQSGDLIWVPCEVRPGPFSNERMVRVGSPGNQRVWFSPDRALEDSSVTDGTARIRARVVEVTEADVSVRIPGHGIAANVFRAPAAEAAAWPQIAG